MRVVMYDNGDTISKYTIIAVEGKERGKIIAVASHVSLENVIFHVSDKKRPAPFNINCRAYLAGNLVCFNGNPVKSVAKQYIGVVNDDMFMDYEYVFYDHRRDVEFVNKNNKGVLIASNVIAVWDDGIRYA